MVSRQLTTDERNHVAATLADLREHFKVWPTEPGQEWYLVDFAYYEGCGRQPHCIDTLKVAAPLALGNHLTTAHDCEWCMVKSGAEWRYAVTHPALDDPIDLHALDENPLLDPDEHDDDMGAFEPGEGAHESLYAIVKMLNTEMD